MGGKISNRELAHYSTLLPEIQVLREDGAVGFPFLTGSYYCVVADIRFPGEACTNSCCSVCCSPLNLVPQTPVLAPGRSPRRSVPWIPPTNSPLRRYTVRRTLCFQATPIWILRRSSTAMKRPYKAIRHLIKSSCGGSTSIKSKSDR